MNQLTIFDLPLQPEPEPEPTPEPTPEVSCRDENPLLFPYTIPTSPDITSILSVGDRVLILPAKYSSTPNTPGIIAGFVAGEILVRRRDGEGLYLRKELHKLGEQV